MTTRAVIYARISRDPAKHDDGRPGEEGAGVARQVEACRLLIRAREWQEAREPLTDNDVSAFNGAERPAYGRLLAMIRAGEVDAVVAWHADRLVRRVAELVDLIRVCREHGVTIAGVHGDLDLASPVGRMFGTILTAVAEYESGHKGERQAAANLAAARAGKARVASPRPFGFAEDRLSLCPDEAEAVAAAAAIITGGGTLAAACRDWAARGLAPRQQPGRRRKARRLAGWHPNSVRSILLAPRTAGIASYQGEIIYGDDGEPVRILCPDGTPSQLLDPGTWRAVRDVLTDPGRARQQGVRTLLGGLARCRCGNTVIGSVAERGGKRWRIYRCDPATRDGRPGPHVTRRADDADEYVAAVICERLSRPDAADLFASPSQAGAGALYREAATIRSALASLDADRALGLITRARWLAAAGRAGERLAAVEARIAESGRAHAAAGLAGAADVAQRWDKLDTTRRRAVVDALAGVTLHPAGRGQRTFDPRSVQVTPRTTGDGVDSR